MSRFEGALKGAGRPALITKTLNILLALFALSRSIYGSIVDLSLPLPGNETERLAALERLQIVGTPPAGDFDAVLALALQMTGCASGLIGLMEADRHWFKAEIGIGCREVPRDVSLGNQAMRQDGPCIIEDLARDTRFCDEPIVTVLGLRFYAGIALCVEGGLRVGTLCLGDRTPRAAVPGMAAMLERLGRVVEGLLESHAKAITAKGIANIAEARERELWKKTRMLEQSERLTKIGTWEMDLDSKLVSFSPEAYKIHEIDPGDPIDLSEIRGRWPKAHFEQSKRLFQKIIRDGQGYDYVAEIITARGTWRWMHSIIGAEQKDGKVVRVFGTIRDVTAEHEAEQKLWRAAHLDTLTGAPNRHHWNIRLDEAFVKAKSSQSGLTIMMFDLDGFKEINDTRGHSAGDAVLREVARRLGEALPEGAFHARLGGDEFAVLVEGAVCPAGIEAILRTLLATIKRPIVFDALRIQISGTFGCASFPGDAATLSDLMQNADLALYQAKRSHRSSFVSFRPEISGLFSEKRKAIDLAAAAIEAGRLVPFYQPKVDLKTGRPLGLEALCRIEAADGTILGPSHFLPALTDPASSARIGAVMLELVTADIAAWLAAGLKPGRVAINVASSDFENGDLDRRVLDRLAALHLPASALEIEVTENTILGKEAVMVGAALEAMRDKGIVIALDDFGTGYASLTHLRDAPIQCLKLDRSFISGLSRGGDSAIIVKSVVDLAHELGLRIVAEGIETRGQAEFLRAIGCDEGQGFLFGRPVSRAASRELLEAAASPARGRKSRVVGSRGAIARRA